jgi:glycogen debranching enzyme
MQLQSRPGHHTLRCGRLAMVVDLHGQVTAQATEGLFVNNTRMLSQLQLRVDGQTLPTFAMSPTAANELVGHYQVPPTETVPEESLFIELRHQLTNNRLVTEATITSYHRGPVSAQLAFAVQADFADSQEAETGQRMQEGPVEVSFDPSDRTVEFTYGHPDLDRRTLIRVAETPSPVQFEQGELRIPLTLDGKDSLNIRLETTAMFDGRPAPPGEGPGASIQDVASLQQQLLTEAPRLVTTNPSVTRAWDTAVADLASLALGMPSGPAAPAAGMPIYQFLFTRDVLTTAWQAAMATPAMAADALTVSAAWQGTRIDDWRDEEPGKLIHQARYGPTSALGINPFSAYFGDYAAVGDFLILLGQHLAWTADLETTRSLLPAARQALQWLDRYADADGDGFIEYVVRSEQGPPHQGWKDSPTAIVDANGEVIDPPVATCELQGYWYIGLRQAALAFLLAGDRIYAKRLLSQARTLRSRFNQRFWMDDEHFYALGLAPDDRVLTSITSNPGHLLATGIVPVDRASDVIGRLLADDMFSGWGVRTLSTDHPSYNPFSYHLGSVWPVENATIMLGCVRYGHWNAAHRIAEGLFAATDLFVDNRLPEALGGLPRRDDQPHPGIYPSSNEPQAWSASAVILAVQAMLGLRPVAPAKLLLVDPHLPQWLPYLELHGLRVGNATVDLVFTRRDDGRTTFKVRKIDGPLRIRRQPPPQTVPRGPISAPLNAAERIFA